MHKQYKLNPSPKVDTLSEHKLNKVNISLS